MLTKLKELSTQAKIAIAAGLAALLALGIGVAVWQPWNQPAEEPPQVTDGQQEPAVPQEPEEKPLSLRVGNENVPCTLHEGDGWTAYVPEGWQAEPSAQGEGLTMISPEGAEVQIALQRTSGEPFASLSSLDGSDRQMQFCGGGAVLTARAPKAQWTQVEKLFAALARTLEVGTETPFAQLYILPQEPDWQVEDGYTVLFLEKDGVILNDKAQEAVEEFMRSWPAEDREDYTGQYRINGIDWAADYTGLSEGYIDVFRVRVQYRVAEGAEDILAQKDGVTLVDGWASFENSVYLVYDHDSGEFRSVTAAAEADWSDFAGLIA